MLIVYYRWYAWILIYERHVQCNARRINQSSFTPLHMHVIMLFNCLPNMAACIAKISVAVGRAWPFICISNDDNISYRILFEFAIKHCANNPFTLQRGLIGNETYSLRNQINWKKHPLHTRIVKRPVHLGITLTDFFQSKKLLCTIWQTKNAIWIATSLDFQSHF